MKIAIIGTGNVGGNLGRALSKAGHEIVFAARDPQSPKTRTALTDIGSNATAVPLAEGVAASDIIFMTVPWAAVSETLQAAGDLSGKTLIDCTNRMGGSTEKGNSSVEEVARLTPAALVVKAFNTASAETILKPSFGEQKTALFYCGDSAEAKANLKQLATEIGFDPIDLGGLANGYQMDTIFQVWITLAMRQGMGRRLAFKMLTPADE